VAVGEPAELDAEDELGERRQHDDRQRQQDQRADERDVVEGAAPADAGDDAGGDGDGRRDEDRDDRQLDGDGPGVGKHAVDAATGQRRAEVTGEQALDVVPVLLKEGVVEVVSLGEGDALALSEGPLSCQRLEGVVLVGEHERVHDEGGAEEGEHHLQ